MLTILVCILIWDSLGKRPIEESSMRKGGDWEGSTMMLKGWSARTTKARAPALLRGLQHLRENVPTSRNARVQMHLPPVIVNHVGGHFNPSAFFGCNFNSERTLEAACEKGGDGDLRCEGESDA